jgi:hypothetical protein
MISFSNFVHDNDDDDKVELFQEIFQSLLGDGIFNMDEELWCNQRKIASFEFASKILCNFRTEVFRALLLEAFCHSYPCSCCAECYRHAGELLLAVKSIDLD